MSNAKLPVTLKNAITLLAIFSNLPVIFLKLKKYVPFYVVPYLNTCFKRANEKATGWNKTVMFKFTSGTILLKYFRIFIRRRPMVNIDSSIHCNTKMKILTFYNDTEVFKTNIK